MPRNASGIYTLPTGNPVTPGTTIESTWANSTLSDIGTELTNSLSRTGSGGMLAAFRIADGTVAAPGLAFTNETGTGLYRAGSGEMWTAVQGLQVQQYTINGVLIPTGKTFTSQGNATFGGTVGVTGVITANNMLAMEILNGYQTITRTTNDTTGLVHLGFYRGTGAGAYAAVRTTGDGTNGVSALSLNINGTDIASATSTGLAVTGTVSATGGLSVPTGTANGVTYLNGSKLLTSGARLTFDGTEVFTNSGGTIQYNDVKGSAAAGTRLSAGGTLGTNSFDVFQNASAGYVYNRANTPLVFGSNNTEQVTIETSGRVVLQTGALQELKRALAANNIDVRSGNYFSKTISGITTLTVSNVPATGGAATFVLDLTNGGSAAITWWSGVKWVGGTPPTLTAAGRDVLGFFTYDGGTIWTGLVLGKDVK